MPALSDVIEHYWYSNIELSQAAVQNYATPLLQGLTFNFKKQPERHAYDDKVVTLYKQAYFFGQPTSPRVITTNENGVDILGVKFKPLGIAKVTGINMEHMADQFIAVEDVWGSELELLCEEMQSMPTLELAIGVLERFLWSKYLHTSLHYRIDNVQNALQLIAYSKGTMGIQELQCHTNTSRKTLERAFVQYLGLTPKFYSRIVRFNTVKEELERIKNGESLTALAYQFGFYDSSHFAAEFKYFSGHTPTVYQHSLIK